MDVSIPAAAGLGRARAGLAHARTLFAFAVAVSVGVAAWLIGRTAILQPYSDMFDWMVRYYRLQADGDLGRYLWAPHNFHHMVWMFVVLEADIRLFGAHGLLFLAVGAVCWAAAAGLLAFTAQAAAPAGWRLVGAGGALALGLMGCDVLDASVVINTTYVLALVFAVAAVAAAEWPLTGPARRLAPWLSIVLAAAAGLASAAGLAVWPALLLGAALRRDRGRAALMAASGAAFALLYAVGESGPINPAGGAFDRARLIEAATLVCDYLGLPWSRGLEGAGPALGLLVLAASAWALVAGLPAARSGPQRCALQWIAFSLVTALMAGAARTGGPAPGLAPMRYAALMIPLHVGLWIVLLPKLAQALEARPRLAPPALAAAAILMLAQQAVMAVYAERTADANRRIIADFQAGRRSPQMLITIYPDLAKAEALTTRMRRDGLYQP